MKEKTMIRTLTRIAFLIAAALYLAGCGDTSTWQDKPETLEQRLAPYAEGLLEELAAMDEPQPLKDQVIRLSDNSEAPLSSLKGKTLLINFWASWCAPCRAEMKDLANLRAELGDASFDVVAINADRGGIKMADRTLKEWGITGLDLYADPSLELVQFYAPVGLPTSLIVNDRGEIIARYLGELDWDAPEAIAFFQALKAGEI